MVGLVTPREILRFGARLAVVLLASVQSAACGGHVFEERTGEQAFPDPKLAALATAACAGNVADIERTIEAGVSPNGLGLRDDTPLIWAVDCQNLAGTKALLNAGADPNLKTPDKSYTVEESVKMGRFPPGPLQFYGFTATYHAAGLPNSAILRTLLEHGGDPNTFEGQQFGRTALNQALDAGAQRHGWDNWYLLLNAGANINVADDAGNTIAIVAAVADQYDRVAELLERGYHYDLGRLGALVHGPSGGAFMESASRMHLIEMLKARGVLFHEPGKPNPYVGTVRMNSDKSLKVDWWPKSARSGSSGQWVTEIIHSGDSAYDKLLERVGGLEPNFAKSIPRNSKDLY